jgi:hypothetical protein
VAHGTSKTARVWIDADAACVTGMRRDPDDCLALLALARASPIVGQATLAPNQTDVNSRMATGMTGRPTKPQMLSA